MKLFDLFLIVVSTLCFFGVIHSSIALKDNDVSEIKTIMKALNHNFETLNDYIHFRDCNDGKEILNKFNDTQNKNYDSLSQYFDKALLEINGIAAGNGIKFE